jgi:hypothetical protein
MIVPENLYNGANAMALRKELAERRGPLLLRGFENAKKHWFPDVHTAAKFCMFVSPPSPTGEHAIDASFCIRTNQQLRDLPNRVSIPAWVSQEIGGEAIAIPEIRSALEVEILERLYNAYPRFSEGYAELGGQRPYAAELHTGNERDTFTENNAHIPLYEGKMVDQYDYRAKEYISGRGRSATWRDLDFKSTEKQIRPQWHIDPGKLDQHRLNRISHYRIGFCNVTSPTNKRSLIATMIPRGAICGDPVPTVLLETNTVSSHFFWLSVANSVATDFIARKKVALHMTYPIVDSLPIPAMDPWGDAEKEMTRLAASLTLNGDDMRELALMYSNEDPEWNQVILTDPELRHQAKAQIDAIYASQILGLTRKQLMFILDPYPFRGRPGSREHQLC